MAGISTVSPGLIRLFGKAIPEREAELSLAQDSARLVSARADLETAKNALLVETGESFADVLDHQRVVRAGCAAR